MKFASEEKLVDKVEKCLKKNGIKTWREVIPDQCEHWEKPYRVDLIFYLPNIGYIGVEAKNTRTLCSGGILAKAITQIEDKYMNKTYFKGNVISRWTILAPLDVGFVGDGDSDDVRRLIEDKMETFIRTFLNKKFGISLLRYTPERKYYAECVDVKCDFKIGGENTYNG